MKRLYRFLLSLVFVCAFSAAATAAVGETQMLVNKQYLLTPSYMPVLTALSDYARASSGVRMTYSAAAAYGQMAEAAAAAGAGDFYGASGYRAYDLQDTLYRNKIAYYRNQGYSSKDAAYYAGRVVAPPGASEHQTGMAIDVLSAENSNSMTESFGDTKAGKWLSANSWRYGFILRYPADKTAITGCIYEPWHFRYIGAPHAEYMVKNKLCLEEYIALLKKQGTVSFTNTYGQAYLLCYLDTLPTQDPPGSVVSISRATTSGGWLVTMRPPLFDLIGHWSEPDVRALVSSGIASGYVDNTFRPDKVLCRGELYALAARAELLLDAEAAVTAEVQAEQLARFADVAAEAYFAQPLAQASANGWLADAYLAHTVRLEQAAPDAEQAEGDAAEQTGLEEPPAPQPTSKLLFSATEQVTRGEAAVMLAPLLARLPEAERVAETPLFADIEALPSSELALKDAVARLAAYDVVRGTGDGFHPEAPLIRAELCVMLNRILHLRAIEPAGVEQE